jgi:flagellar protein FliS
MNHQNRYKTMQITTASKPQILIMLYEAAIQNCRKTIEAIEKKDIPAKCRHIGKVHDIILELQASLNFDVGGKIAEDLEALYTFIGTQLLKANAENSVETMQSVIKILDNLLQGWKGALEKMQKEMHGKQGNGAPTT